MLLGLVVLIIVVSFGLRSHTLHEVSEQNSLSLSLSGSGLELVPCESELLLPSASVNMVSTSRLWGRAVRHYSAPLHRSPSPTGTDRLLGALTERSEQIDPCQQHCIGTLIPVGRYH